MVRQVLVGCTLTAFVVGLAVPVAASTPRRVELGGHVFDVSYAAGHVWLVERDDLVHDLGRGQQLLVHDFSGDGTPDLGVFDDRRDGFRETFAYLEIWTNDGTPVTHAFHETAKWKEGQWAWIDVARYPGLDPSTITGRWFARFMRARDAAHRW